MVIVTATSIDNLVEFALQLGRFAVSAKGQNMVNV